MKKKFKKATLFILKAGSLAFLSGVIIGLLLLIYFSKDLPQPEKFTERELAEPTEIYDRTGDHLLYTIFGEEKRRVVPLSEISPYLQKAVIAAEDENFYEHHGIDPRGIVRALLVNLKLKGPEQGASTIPQQLIRSTYLTPQKTIQRKVREIILSIELDRRYDKDEILEWYLNQIPFGSNAYGAEAASKTFFGKKAKDLTLAESAVLASVIQAPTYLSPYGSRKAELLSRKDYVLDRMAEQGFITQEEASEAKNEELEFEKVASSIEAPHFVLEVRKYLFEKYGEAYLKRKGLRVYTTLNKDLQDKADEIVQRRAKQNEAYRCYNAALVAMDPDSGEVLALVGNRDYFADSYPEGCISGKTCLFDPEFNVALLGKRQPGSSFKPIVYATAFEKGYNDEYTVVDEETDFGVWGGKHYVPQNYDGQFRGEVTLRQALAQSLNVPSVKVLVNLAGIADSVKQAKDMGITTLRDPTYYGPSLVLGGGEMTLFDMVSAFSSFANGGMRYPPKMILRIEDKDGAVLERADGDPKRVVSSRSARLITSILSDEEARKPMFGPNSALYVNDKTAAKTGTTQYYQDAWTIGYNQNLVAGVWAGNNDNSPSYNKPGVTLAAPIWKEFMLKSNL